MRQILLISTLMLACCLSLQAQDEGSGTVDSPEELYDVSILVGGGYSRDVSKFVDDRPDLTLNRNQFSFFGRLLWRPGHLLTGGLEGGYMNFYSVSNESGGKSVRNGIPLYMIFSMSPLNGFDVTVGYGLAIMGATAEGPNGKVGSSVVSTTVMAAASYKHSIAKDLDLGGEFRFSTFDHLDDYTMALSLIISYKLTSY